MTRGETPETEGRATDELRWSLKYFGLSAAVWGFVALAFFVSWLPERERGQPLYSEVVWYFTNYFLWFLLTPLVFTLAKALPIFGAHRARNIWIHVGVALAVAMTHVLIFLPTQRWLDPDFHLRFPSLAVAFKNNFLYRTITGMVTYGLVLTVFSSIAFLRRARLEEQRLQILQRQLAEARLQALRMQIQPHFLFNTLHSISSLVHEAPSEALTMVSRLGDFLRATLDRGARETVRFEEELRFAALYLDIEKVRFSDRLRVIVTAPPEVLGLETPTLILQPLIENAIRHGVAPAMGPVDLTISAAVQDGVFEITVRNVETGARPPKARAERTDGLGLANTRDRLERAYGASAALIVKVRGPADFEATVRIPARDVHV